MKLSSAFCSYIQVYNTPCPIIQWVLQTVGATRRDKEAAQLPHEERSEEEEAEEDEEEMAHKSA